MEKQKYLAENLEFWQFLSVEQRQQLVDNTAMSFYKKGEMVYSATQECLGAVCVLSGALRVFILSDDGKEVTLMRTQKGELCMLTASCVVRQINFDVHVEVEQDCKLLMIGAPIYAQLMRDNMQVELCTLRRMADKFSDVMYMMEQILFLSIEVRLAIFLLDEVSRTKNPILHITHEQIAKYIGSAREVVTRTLKGLAKIEAVYLQRGTVQVLDRDKLREIARNTK